MDAFKQKVRENWNVHAKDYDEQYQHGLKSAGEREAWMKLLAQLIPEKNARILDVGAGTGFLSLMLAQQGHQVKGVDLSPGMLDKARKKAKTAKLGNIEFAEGDAEALEEPSEKYDIVINRHLLWAMPNPKQAVSEWARVLKPGGRLIIIDGDWHYDLWSNNLKIFFGKLLLLLVEHKNEFGSQSSGISDSLPMTKPENAKAAPKLVGSVGLTVSVTDAKEVEAAENAAMPLRYRLLNPYHRIIIIGKKPENTLKTNYIYGEKKKQ